MSSSSVTSSRSPTPTSESESTPESSVSEESLSSRPAETSSAASESSSSTYSEISYNVGSKCVNCMDEIPTIGISCAEAVCKDMRLCTECFSLGAELGPHKVTHRYRFFHSGRMEPVTPPRVGAPGPASIISTRAATTGGSVWYEEEEIRLLKGLELYGHGNWSEIANFISTKTAQEAKEEYNNRYVDGVIGQLTWGTLEVNPDGLPIDHTVRPHPPLWPEVPTDTEEDDDAPDSNKRVTVPMGPLSPSLTSKLPPLECTKEEMRLLGVMPKRDDYEKEWENDAEQLVSNLSFDSDDDELELGMKFALIDMYASKVRERAKRKRIVREHQLVAEFFRTYKVQQACANKAPLPAVAGPSTSTSVVAYSDHPLSEVPGVRDKIDLYRRKITPRMRPFVQFFAAKKDFDTLVSNLVMEEELKLRLLELYKYRRLGFTKHGDIYAYEDNKEEVNKNEKLMKRGLEPLTESENEGTTVGEGDEQSEDNGEDEDDIIILPQLPKPKPLKPPEEDDDDEFELLSVGNTSDEDETYSPVYYPNCHPITFVTPMEKNKKRPASSLAKARKRKPKTKRFFRQKSHTPQIIEMRQKLKLQNERMERKKKKSANEMEPQLTTTRSGRVAKKLNL